jgi:hypothetical protein
MDSKLVMRDPTAETSPILRERKRLAEGTRLDQLTVALFDIGKTRGDEFMARMQQLLTQRQIAVRRYRKPTNTRTAPVELLQRVAAECQAVVVGLSD